MNMQEQAFRGNSISTILGDTLPADRFRVSATSNEQIGGDFTTAGQAFEFALKVQRGEVKHYSQHTGRALHVSRVRYLPSASLIATLGAV